MPGDRPDRFERAAASGADVVICDLEDAVKADAKDAAREHVVNWLTSGGRACVRLNAATTSWFPADVAALADTPGLLALMVPKAEDPQKMQALADQLRPGSWLIALVESAQGLSHATQLASIPNVRRMAFGSLDYTVDINATHCRDALLLARSQLVLSSRLAGRPGPIDGVTTAVNDRAAVVADARHAHDLGMTGKLCVHPSQTAPVNDAFSPTESEIAWATEVLATVKEAAGASTLHGQLVDRPVIERAAHILANSR